MLAAKYKAITAAIRTKGRKSVPRRSFSSRRYFAKMRCDDSHASRGQGRPRVIALSLAIYLNFFTDHFGIDLRWPLFAAAALLFGRTIVHFKVWRIYRRMPLLPGLGLVSLFIWFSENIGTFTRTWLYPSQHHAWAMVSPAKLGSWFLLLIISYTLVSLVNPPRPIAARRDTPSRRAAPKSAAA